MDQAQSATPAAAAQWYSVGPSRSVKRSLFSAGSSRRPVPVDREEVTSSEQSAAGPNRPRYDWVRAGVPFNRSLSMRVKSSKHATKNCSVCSSNACHHHTSPRTKGRNSSIGHSAAHEFEFHSFSTSAMTTGNGLNGDVLYGTPTTQRTRHQPATSASDRPAAGDRRPPPVRSPREPWRPPEMEFSATSADDRRCAGLELAVEERDGELRDLRQTMESNERALLRSLDDERRRWSAERLLLQAELLSARRHRLPGGARRGGAFRSPSVDRGTPGDRVVVVEPSQRAPAAADTAPTTAADGIDAGAEKFRPSCAGKCDATAASAVTSLPVEPGGRSRAETGRQPRSSPAKVDRPPPGSDDVAADRLRVELELCRREFADERRRWADEKRVVVEYQLRLQTYCRQLAERNQLLDERLRSMSVEQGRSAGSSGYGSDSAALVVQCVDDSSLLTSTL